MFNDGPRLAPVFICERDMYAETLTKRWQPQCRTDPLLTPKLDRIFTYPNILDCGPSWCCFYNFCGFWHFQLQSLQSFLFFCQVCILQRGPNHINVPMPVKGSDVRCRSCLNNNAGPQTYKCVYDPEGLWCQIHKLFKQQRRSTNSAVTFVL